MAAEPPPIQNVSDTALWVAYYRARETKRSDRLFSDPLAEKLVGDKGKRIASYMKSTSKYTEWTVIIRTVVIDRFISDLIKAGIDAVVNLGAGMDTRPYRMNLPVSLKWFEVDFPSVIAHKENILKDERPVCKLQRIACDLSNGSERKAVFAQVARECKKALILTEGVVIYLTEDQVHDLAHDLFEHPEFNYWIVEYMDPNVYPYLKQEVRTEKLRNAPIRFLPEDWLGFFEYDNWCLLDIEYHGEEGARLKRWMPMPLFGRILSKVAPAKVLERTGKLTGYVILRRQLYSELEGRMLSPDLFRDAD